jgi:hypothetical protein
MPLTAILNLLQIAIPGALQIYTLIHDRATGTTTLIVNLDAADSSNADTLKQIAAWQASHPITPPAVPAPPAP